MKVIIAGGRDIEDYNLLRRVITASCFQISTVVSGMARGVDTMGIKWAKENGIDILEFPADWNTYGKAAGPIRNIAMSKIGDALIAIRKDGSKGTAHMISLMEKLGKPTYVHWIGRDTLE